MVYGVEEFWHWTCLIPSEFSIWPIPNFYLSFTDINEMPQIGITPICLITHDLNQAKKAIYLLTKWILMNQEKSNLILLGLQPKPFR
jgi:hypothetical protein